MVERPSLQIALLTSAAAVNGMIVAAIGPSLQTLSAATGMSQQHLNSVIIHNRFAKIVGLLVWTCYANNVGRVRWLPPRFFMAGCLAVMALAAATLTQLRSSRVALHGALVAMGLAYGISDTGLYQLSLWGSSSDRARRAAFAIVASGFTMGAFLSPMVIAASTSTSSLGGAYVAYAALALLATLSALGLACAGPMHRPTEDEASTAADVEMTEALVGKTERSEKRDGACASARDEHADLLPLFRHMTTSQLRRALRDATGTLPPHVTVESASTREELLALCEAHLSHLSQANKTVEEAAAFTPAFTLPYTDGRRAQLVTACISVVLFCITSSEHAIATWLPFFGARVGSVDESTMAAISAAYWGAIALGRVCWSALASRQQTAWPVLLFDLLLMLASSALFVVYAAGGGRATWMLWVGSVGMGLGIASAFPSAMVLPEEAQVTLTPNVLMALSLMGSRGEMTGPAVLGHAFATSWWNALGLWNALLSTIALLCAARAYAKTTSLARGEPAAGGGGAGGAGGSSASEYRKLSALDLEVERKKF